MAIGVFPFVDASGKAPDIFVGWPCSWLKSDDKVIVRNVESQVNLIWKTYQAEIRGQEIGLSSSSGEGTPCESSETADSGDSSSY